MREVYIVDAVRTPVGRMGGTLKNNRLGRDGNQCVFQRYKVGAAMASGRESQAFLSVGKKCRRIIVLYKQILFCNNEKC